MSILKIGDLITAESVFPEGATGYFDVFEMAEDGSRRVTKRAASALANPRWHERRQYILSLYDRPVLWAAMGLPTSRLGPAVGQYAPYPVDPTNLLAIQLPPSIEPVNNIPWTFGWRELNDPANPEQGGFLKHACTFAYQMGRGYSPFAYMMGEEAHFDMQPLTPHSDESNHRNRVGLRYWRCLVGVAFRNFERFEGLAPEGDPLISTRDWRTRLPLMKELERVPVRHLPQPHVRRARLHRAPRRLVVGCGLRRGPDERGRREVPAPPEDRPE